MAEERRENEVVVPLGAHAFVLNTNNGMLQTNTGPQKITITGTEKTVVFDPSLPSRFREVPPSQAVQTNRVVPKGSYAILKHPHKELLFPRESKPDELLPGMLEIGKVVNLAGPRAFALWPGQEVEIVGGHHLKTNEYLVVRVYDEDQARKNWNTGTAVTTEPSKTESPGTDAKPSEPGAPVAAQTTYLEVDPKTLKIGDLLLIKGTDISFFIPPTGIEVVKDTTNGTTFVRQALTLERLEYCLLVDQDGNKRYVPGADVVFPKPTETFKLNDDGERKSKAYELNDISGIHLKVISSYEKPAPHGVRRELLEKAGFHVAEDGKTVSNQEGEELFITGRVMPIYFPCVEQAILTYDSAGKKRSRHHAVAINPGDARYVMNRLTGEIATIRSDDTGMLLCDPRTEVIVQRILSDNECARYYPANERVRAYNQMLRDQNSDPEYEMLKGGPAGASAYRTGHVETDVLRSANYSVSMSRAGDTISRGSSFTPPRKLTFDPGKFDGTPKISPWTGYAVQLVNAKGKRDVVIGPQTVNLDFDQRLEALFLSTGTPKQHDNPKETSYLKIDNNVSDEFSVTTKDLVTMKVRLKYRTRFDETLHTKWFNVDNYVQLLVDHFRSTISAEVRKMSAPDFFMDAASILRQLVLGADNAHTFGENGMQVYDLEISNPEILDKDIAAEMRKTQIEKLRAQFTIAQKETELDATRRTEIAARAIETEKFETVNHKMGITVKTVEIEHVRDKTKEELLVLREVYKFEANKSMADLRLAIATVESSIDTKEFEIHRIREVHGLDLRCRALTEEAKAMETRSTAIQPELVAALTALAQTGQFEVAAKHLGNLAILHDMSLGGMIEHVFKGSPLEATFKQLASLGKGKLLEPTAAS